MTAIEEEHRKILETTLTSYYDLFKNPPGVGAVYQEAKQKILNDALAALSQQHEREIAKAEHKGRHAEVVKALFLMETLGPAFDVQGWLNERLADLKQQQPNGGTHE